ncbi:MAG: substrate-binding periplasmic protein [Minwuia sp.]|uniref:substrate-binding periplasmic protein n=1 Tax=Minwuia sp. TaxID=2493630 RepID=UPI003A8ADCF6
MKKLILAAAMALAAPLPADADTLKICFEDWAPFHSIEGGKPAGIQIELTDRALAALGHDAAYSLMPYLDCIAAVTEGRQDAMLLTSGEEPLVPATVSTVFWEIGMVARPDWPEDRFESLADFNGARVGMIEGYVYPEAVDIAALDWTAVKGRQDILNLRAAAAGKLDLIVIDVPWALRKAREEGLKVKALEPRLTSTPQYTYFNPDRAALGPALGAELQKLIADGTVNAIYERETGMPFSAVQARAGQTLLD